MREVLLRDSLGVPQLTKVIGEGLPEVHRVHAATGRGCCLKTHRFKATNCRAWCYNSPSLACVGFGVSVNRAVRIGGAAPGALARLGKPPLSCDSAACRNPVAAIGGTGHPEAE